MRLSQHHFMLLALLWIGMTLVSCQDQTASVKIDDMGDGTFTGTGGDAEQSKTWENVKAQAHYNIDITAASTGSATLILKDSTGAKLLEETVSTSSGNNASNGVSGQGQPGPWTITVKLSNFYGDGTFSVDPN